MTQETKPATLEEVDKCIWCHRSAFPGDFYCEHHRELHKHHALNFTDVIKIEREAQRAVLEFCEENWCATSTEWGGMVSIDKVREFVEGKK